MDQPGMMRAGEAVETLPRNLNESGCIEWTGLHRSLERLTLNVFHDDVGRLAIHAQIVNRNNVGVPQRGQAHGLLPGIAHIISLKVPDLDLLDGNSPSQVVVPCREYLPGSAFPE